MLIDCHIHTNPLYTDKAQLIKNFDAAGVDKGILFSYQPASFCVNGGMGDEMGRKPLPPEKCLEVLKDWASYSDRIIPFYWIDPMDGDALGQVDRAIEAGVAGFKVICNRFYPGDARPMEVWAYIASKNKPILFHSGILYSATPSSKYNRPVGFEPLLDVPNLRFAMAHVSWPWHDECIAVYGYWNHRREIGSTTAQMFIDTTPGTPKIYRKEVFAKLYSTYDIDDNIIFGTDCSSDYRPEYTQYILEMDKEALDVVDVAADRREKYYSKNVLRFLGQ